MVVPKNGGLFIYFYPFRGGKKIGIKLLGVRTKTEAKLVEADIVKACRTEDFSALNPVSREACIRMYQNQGWETPPELATDRTPREELTLWRSMELCLKYPGVKDSANRERTVQCFLHVVEYFGKDKPVKEIWIPHVKEYQIHRLNEGAAPATVNREKSALSKLFQVLVELRHIDVNPARLVKPLSEKSSRRSVYLSHEDFQRIVAHLPDWYRPIAQTAFFTGMRRGEILGLTWKRVNLKAHMLYLGPDDVKEKDWKRVPIHRELLPILEGLRHQQVIGLDRLFMHNGSAVTHRDQVRWVWDRNAAKVEGLNPLPHFHDLRHTWKVNARRSGMHPEIETAIMGHASRAKGVHEGYGRISNDELIAAIDKVTFDHGETEIWVAEKKNPAGKSCRGKNSNSVVTADLKAVAKNR
jgi:integrase